MDTEGVFHFEIIINGLVGSVRFILCYGSMAIIYFNS